MRHVNQLVLDGNYHIDEQNLKIICFKKKKKKKIARVAKRIHHALWLVEWAGLHLSFTPSLNLNLNLSLRASDGFESRQVSLPCFTPLEAFVARLLWGKGGQ